MLRLRILPKREKLRHRCQQILLKLHERFKSSLRSPDGSADREFLPGGRAEDLAQEKETQSLLEDLYRAHWEYRNSQKHRGFRCTLRRTPKDEQRLDDAARAFYDGILGDLLSNPDTPDTRVEILALIALCNLPPESTALRKFVEHTLNPHRTDGHFCDSILIFRGESEAKRWFGSEDDTTCKLLHKQYVVRPFVVNGDERTVPDNGRRPELREERISTTDDEHQVFKVKVDPRNFRGSVPSDWIVRKDVSKDSNNEEVVDSLLQSQMKQHTHIRKIYGYARHKDRTCIYMELGSCSLLEKMTENKWPKYNLASKARAFGKILGIIDALRHMQDGVQQSSTPESICHRDLKLANILLGKDYDQGEIFKLSDFGISIIGGSSCGDLILDQFSFLPPECLSKLRPKQSLSTDSDKWSLGCLCLEYLAWICNGMGSDTDTKGLLAFRSERENLPCPEVNDRDNDRFFIAEAVTDEHERNDRDFYTSRLSDHGKPPLVMKLNPGVTRYYDRACAKDDPRPQREKDFIHRLLKIFTTIVLVPNPLLRGSMDDIYDQLAGVVTEFGDDD